MPTGEAYCTISVVVEVHPAEISLRMVRKRDENGREVGHLFFPAEKNAVTPIATTLRRGVVMSWATGGGMSHECATV